MMVDLPRHAIEPALDALSRSTRAVVDAAASWTAAEVEQPAELPGWTRLTVLAHLRYVAAQMTRMTIAAQAGRSLNMYPDGRDRMRPATLVLAPGESIAQLLASFRAESFELIERWRTLTAEQWEMRIDEFDHGNMPLSRLLALRLTELEVHRIDLGLGDTSSWDEVFVHHILPLRLAWLTRARARDDADLTVNGSWMMSDGDRAWFVEASGRSLDVRRATDATMAQCRIRASPHALLAFVLGRDCAEPLVIEGDRVLAERFKAAFPGP